MNAFAEEFISYLNLIHRLSVGENAGKTQNMVQCIVNQIRYKYMRKDEIVRLSMELSQVDNLIGIFRARFGENLSYGKNVRDSLPDPYLPSNTVLSLVESALVLGLIPKEGDWRLNIDMDETDQGLRIRITDNGIGLVPSRTDPAESGSERRSVIAAVNSRLKEYYADFRPDPPEEEREPVTFSFSGSGNRTTILIPRSRL